MDYHDIPVYLNNHNRLDLGFRDLLLWLRCAGMRDLVVIDNGSTFPPLLDFYDSAAMSGVTLLRVNNLGPTAFWRLDLHKRAEGPFVVTDADVVPDPDCPLDLVGKMVEVAARERFSPLGAKVGPAIRIDDLPAEFAQRAHMRVCESDYWQRKYPEGDCWNAAIDTVFALYKPGWDRWPLAAQGGVEHVRLDFPYVVQHKPWYSDSANLTAEERYYRANVAPGYSSSCPEPIPDPETLP